MLAATPGAGSGRREGRRERAIGQSHLAINISLGKGDSSRAGYRVHSVQQGCILHPASWQASGRALRVWTLEACCMVAFGVKAYAVINPSFITHQARVNRAERKKQPKPELVPKQPSLPPHPHTRLRHPRVNRTTAGHPNRPPIQKPGATIDVDVDVAFPNSPATPAPTSRWTAPRTATHMAPVNVERALLFRWLMNGRTSDHDAGGTRSRQEQPLFKTRTEGKCKEGWD
ncbi:predicted protein [Histoplasma capsulatum G186AR]|uniref:Uncharacterized protein n=1 Tax=Ajellomyces capsulatus (strain G186AR / H82 / ATCC MYA-2454 / RMSCC 2432) TaxID=447093 RepID=C0NX07_AJECG|nr:uncharacterized protein HCBG_07999 [Histoplasma capsulatum G186AR]EEH03873.1 predicted protein [Histoplasma capsulatum G186AR]